MWRGGVDAFDRAVKHGPAEIDERDGLQRQELQEFERVIPSAASHIEELGRLGADAGGRAGDEFEGERRIDGGGLSGLEVGEALDIGIEAAADFLGAGFGSGHILILP